VRLGRVARFALVGVVNTATYFALYLLSRTVLPYLVAHVLAFSLAMIGSYFLSCRFTFRVSPSWRTFWLFPLSNLSNFVITTAGLYLLVDRLGFDPRWAALAAAVIAIPITFFVAQFVLTGSGPMRPLQSDRSVPGRQEAG
jgi:putative flippase GtrA